MGAHYDPDQRYWSPADGAYYYRQYKVNAEKLKQFEDILYGIDAPEFSQTNTYSVGDHVTYQSKIYKCKSEVSVAGAWSADKWEEVTNAEARLPLPDEIIALFGTEG